MRLDDRDVLDVNPQGVLASAAGVRARSLAVAAQRRACDGIDVPGADPAVGIGEGLDALTLTWGSALNALSRELDLLGVELGRSAACVVQVDAAGAL
jgi:hypothetical protein